MGLQRRALAVRAFGALSRLVGALRSWPQRLTPPPFRLLQIGSAFWQSRALDVAARLDLATVLGDAEVAVADLASRVGADPDALHRLLRMLAAIGVFEEGRPGAFRNNAVSTWLRTDRPHSMRAIVLMHNSPEMSRPWFEQLEQGVRRGEPPFALTHGEALYAYMDRHPEFDALFAAAMDGVEALTGDSFATAFDWTAFDRLIDVGGSKGTKALAILARHRHLRALVVDRARTIAHARAFWQQHEADIGPDERLARLGFEEGDVLESVPAAASARDAYLLSAVLHGFDDDTAVRALRVVAAAVAPAAATIVVMELVLPPQRPDFTAASIDLQMFVGTRGRERSLDQWRRLFDRAGLRLVEVVRLASFASMLVLRPGRATA
jgi:hypothetical protein